MNMKKSKWFVLTGLLFLSISCKKENDEPQAKPQVFDYDRNIYNTVKIGDQLWLKENLKVKHYQDGTPIPNITDAKEWSNLKSGALCNYNNNDSLFEIYGCLYNNYAMTDSRELCPSGWNVPSQSDWDILIAYVGQSTASIKLKETGTEHWINQNNDVSNSTDFTALPGGLRIENGDFINLNSWAFFGTKTLDSDSLSRVTILFDDLANPGIGADYRQSGYSIRCIKD